MPSAKGCDLQMLSLICVATIPVNTAPRMLSKLELSVESVIAACAIWRPGAQRPYISEDVIPAEHLSVKKSLMSMAQLFEGGPLITEGLHSAAIKPVSQEKIAAVL